MPEPSCASRLFCAGDECLETWPEGPMPEGWTVENVEGRMEPCCKACTAFYAAETADVPFDAMSCMKCDGKPILAGTGHCRSCLSGEQGASDA